MKVAMWDIDRAKDYPQNARRHGERALRKLAASIKAYGFRQPIVVDKEEVIIIGHLRRRAAKWLGLKQCPVHIAADLSPEQVRGLRLMDNRVHEEAVWDTTQLRLELEELRLSDFDLGLTGFDADQMETRPEAFVPEKAPETIERNVAEMKRIESIRRPGTEKVVAKEDTERFLVIVFPSREAKEERLRILGLPTDEKYVSSNAVRLMLVGENLSHETAAPPNKSGACGAF